ncbi:glucan endo-1,3-beta-glucosidase 3-like [Pyrus ussuriensis x Pyrus communis]|uniref:glucan endo-1,3-beta-D-glucosidase n=1 Tax=Pyrus ussuriensis x Pyrus communis TaxID=2448454 RepID=A0A5N5F4N9_9ROSA|nr:glucan endo-1,3-beta-glucosidase 3-like [Pyrus x bretschneideri]KAB2596222.1 glucan endo-1,3-beta-glucosidase 3-like [Pyrus ussuriensis x Pyrus communis]
MAADFLVSLAAILFTLSLLPGSTSLPTTVGATYSASTVATYGTPPAPDRVARAVSSLGLSALRLDASDPAMIRAFLYSNTSLLLTIPNQLVPPLAANRSNALRWLYIHVIPFYPRTNIGTISVGNDLLESSPDFFTFLLPAIRNLRLSLQDLSIHRISVSTTFSFINVITTAFPPSNARFQEPAVDTVIRPLLRFLRDTNSSFLINLYPYNLYKMRSEIPIGFPLFQEHPFGFRDDLTTGVRYQNLFDMMVDAVISAMAVAGYENIPVIVTETGWPSYSTDPAEIDANPVYAEMYIKGLLFHLRSGKGTPLRREGVAETYIYELLDKQVRQGRNWGILYPNLTSKYKEIQYSGSDRGGFFDILIMAVGQFLMFALLAW